jgi:hypothetical protein
MNTPAEQLEGMSLGGGWKAEMASARLPQGPRFWPSIEGARPGRAPCETSRKHSLRTRRSGAVIHRLADRAHVGEGVGVKEAEEEREVLRVAPVRSGGEQGGSDR